MGNPTNYSGQGFTPVASHGNTQGFFTTSSSRGGMSTVPSKSEELQKLQGQNAFNHLYQPTQTQNFLPKHKTANKNADPLGGMSIELGDSKSNAQKSVTGDPFLDLLS